MASLKRAIAVIGPPYIGRMAAYVVRDLQILRSLYYRDDEVAVEVQYGLYPFERSQVEEELDNDADDNEENDYKEVSSSEKSTRLQKRRKISREKPVDEGVLLGGGVQ
ncbi:hypothetical protein BDV29DRAFT_152480 [Aspergillus leporis]|jgi:hypothetical protein|uniref:Uncharacterized protein n=1 Tax=Aspergillus leporis TaxID=41062 RepID=A0A5N5XH27_9EURO|nr:hypothetical protein BDV29DRAFT_152480 [Aspergillus leporis]